MSLLHPRENIFRSCRIAGAPIAWVVDSRPGGARAMKPFVLDRYGRIVFPFNFFPELDFSLFDTLEDFETVIRRDFEDKAKSETQIVAGLTGNAYHERYWLLRDLTGHLFWINRYAMTMYERRPTR